MRGAAVLALLAVFAAPAAAMSPDRIRAAASRTYFHGMTAEIAEREAGRDAVPPLLALLDDAEFSRRDNVVAFLAYLGGAESIPALERVLGRPPASTDRPEDLRAYLLVPHALGRMAGRGEPAALDRLLALTGSDVDAAIRESSVAALALTGSSRAWERLQALAADPASTGAARAALAQFAQPPTLAPGVPDEPVAPAVDFTADTSTRSHGHAITFVNHFSLGNPMTTGRLDTVLANATVRAGTADFDGDVACCTRVARSGSGGTFGTSSDGLNSIDSADELSGVLSVATGRVKVVTAISYCGGPGTNIIGCAYSPGNSMALVRMSDLGVETVLWLHEYGHNLGLGHSSDSRDIMYGSDNGNNCGLNPGACQSFHAPSGGSAASIGDIGACTDDGDSYADPVDNCPLVANENQLDSDVNGVGDICEACPTTGDNDTDGVCNPADNCPATSNTLQADFDGDGLGDACEAGAELADVDRSGRVDGVDLARLGRAFGAIAVDPAYEVEVDLDRDGQVDGADLALLAPQFGKSSS